jgi:hypothetical protein
MIEAIIYLLIKIAILALVIYLVLWVLALIGVPIPARVIQIIWVIVVLIAWLLCWQTISGSVPRLRL